MNLWTVPLRIALSCALYIAMAFLAQAIRDTSWTYGASVDVTKLNLLVAYSAGVLAIWCHGR